MEKQYVSHEYVTVENTEDPEVGGFFAYRKGEEVLGWVAWRGWGPTREEAIACLVEVLKEQEDGENSLTV